MALTTKSKPPVHAKKRQAGHHRHSKQYLKTYWPYLPMLMIVAVGLMINSLWSKQHVLGAASDYSSTSLLQATNADRAQAGEAPLTIDSRLASAAQAKANDMVSANYWAHDSPSGSTPWSFITAAGYSYQAAGENLAYGFDNASQVVTGWMNSTEHRANILNSSYQNVGFGVASSPNYQGKGPEVIIVAEYAEPVSSAAANISFTVPKPVVESASTANTVSPSELSAQPVSRIQLLTGGNATWSTLLISAIAGAAFALFLLRHGVGIRKWLVQGESFITHHPLLDITIVFIFTSGFVLSQASGIIR